MLSHMLYLSRTTVTWSMEELSELVARSQRRNEADGLSGLLLYGRGHFLQLLEGRRQPLVLTYDRIARDPRHAELELLLDGPITVRLFDGWAMGLLNVDQSGAVDRDRFDRIVASFRPRTGPVAESALAVTLLKEFRAHAVARVPGRLPDLA